MEEVVRRSLLERIHAEIPYHVRIETVGFTHLFNGDLRVDQTLHVDNYRHGRIVVGAGGRTLAAIVAAARRQLSAMYGGRGVHLFVRVKARKS